MKSNKILGCAAAILAVAGQAHAVDKSWNVGFGNWNTPANWLNPGVPAAADNVFLGNTAPALNAFVTLNINATIASMTITDGMAISTANARMVVTGDTSISGYNSDGIVGWPSRIQVEDGPNFISDYVTHNLTVNNDAWIDMSGGGLEAQGLLLVGSTGSLSGGGTVRLTSNAAVAMRVDGHLGAGTEGLTINQIGTGRIDLDGSVAGDNVISASVSRIDNSAFSNLTINGDQLADTFDDGFQIVEGGFITVNMTNGWAMGSTSSIEFVGGNPGFTARLNGTDLDFSGELTMLGTGVSAQITAPITIESAADFEVGPQDLLEITSDTTINGGTYAVGLEGQLHFNGTTTIRGGTFTTDSSEVISTPLSFSGPTTWNGVVTFNGRASQDADATVSGPTTITAGAFDMDGNVGGANWVVGNHLTVNADYIDESQNGNGFDAIMTVSGGFASRLSINLSTPGDHWYSSNALNLAGVLNLPTTRIDGSPLQVLADLNITGSVQIDADVTIGSTAIVAFTTPTSELRLSGHSMTYATATYSGQGALHNLVSGDFLLFLQSDLGQTSLINDGSMKVSNLISYASVHRFTQTSTGSWNVQIGGNDPGVLNDVLRVTGAPSTIDGIVNVDLSDSGNGTFLPIIGETFLFLDARPGVTGTFTNSPVTVTPSGTIVEWSFVYTPTQVFLRADRITQRCPADFNQDGIVDFFDYLDFVDAFSAESLAADFNHDGVIDFFDYLDFVDAFSAGC